MSDEKAQKVGRVVFPGLEDVLFIDRERGEERFKKVKEVSTYKPLDEIGFVWEHTVMIDKTAPEDVRKFWEHHAKQWAKEQSMVYVFYKPSCGCEYRMTVLLDRWPMSEKIISHCKECKEGTLLEISDPIEFFIPSSWFQVCRILFSQL